MAKGDARASYRQEDDIDFIAKREDVRQAKCQDPTACTLALAGTRAIGYPVRVVFDDLTGDISIGWMETMDDGRVRLHRGILSPSNQAHRLLLLTDANKHKLLKQMRDRQEDDIRLTVTQHMSRYSHPRPRSQEDKDREKARVKKLKELRAAGLAPPPVRRSGPKVSRGRGLRGIGLMKPEGHD